MKFHLHSKLRIAIVERVTRFGRLKLSTLLFAGLALRLVLAPFTSHPYDIAVMYRVTNDLFAGLNIYTTNSFTYPPLWAYVEYPLFTLVGLISPKLLGMQVNLNLPMENWKLPPIITSPLFNVLCKLPYIIADVLIALIIYDIVKELRDKEHAKFSFVLWFFNPLVIGVSSVHGQFDVLPALMTLLSFCFLCRRNFLASGVTIGLGCLFKIYPVFLTPLYLFSVAALEKERLSSGFQTAKRILTGCLEFAGGILISFCAFLFLLLNSNLYHDVFARTEIIPSLGGLSIFNIEYLPGFEWLPSLIISNSRLVSLILTIVLFAMIILVSYITFRSGGNFKTFLFGHIAILLAVYLTSPTVNPQYILWIVPFLTLSYGLYNHNLKTVIVLSFSALGFLIGLTGPLFFLYPLAIFTPLLRIEVIYANTYFFEYIGGWVVLLISGIVGVAALIFCLKDALVPLLGRGERPIFPGFSQKKLSDVGLPQLEIKWGKVNPSKILALVLSVLIIGQFFAWAQPWVQQSADFWINGLDNQRRDLVRIEYTVKSGGYPMDLQVFATPMTSKSDVTRDKPVFIYYDEAYPSSFVGKERWIGLLDHAPVELELRGYNGFISIVGAQELRNIMEGNHDSIIIIPSGVFPETIHAGNESIVGDWLRAGGTLIWIGDAFGYLSGHRDGSIELFSEGNYSKVQNQILGFTLFNELAEVERYASTSSSFSSALDLQYTDAIVGALVSNVLKLGGMVLGEVTKSENARASICYLPVGKGHLIVFGGGIGRAFTANGEDVIAHDIAQILCSGFPFSSTVSAFNLHELGRNEAREASLDVPLPQNQNVTGIMISAFSKSPYSRFFSRQFCLIDGS